MKISILILLIFVAISTKAQTSFITTVAGNGGVGYTGDGIATAVTVGGGTVELRFDDTGNYYFCLFNRVRKVTPSGYLITIAGTGTNGYNGEGLQATNTLFNNIASVAIDHRSNIYISDHQNQRIRKINSSGIVSTVAGNGIQGFFGDNGLATIAELNFPTGICVDDTGNLYIADAGNNRVRKVDTFGVIRTFVGTGVYGHTGDGGMADTAKIGPVEGMCTDKFGNLFIADGGQVRRIDHLTGFISTVAGNGFSGSGGDGGPATAAGMTPKQLVVDNRGYIYVGDMAASDVRVVDTYSIIHTITGLGYCGYNGDSIPATSALLCSTRGVGVDSCGNLYICDNSNGRIRKVTFPLLPLFSNITASPSDTICAETYITFTAHDTGGGYITNYEWFVNGTQVSGATNATYGYHPAGGDSIYCVSMSGSPCAGWDTVRSNAIHIVSIPLATPTISLSGVTVAALGSSVTVNAAVAGAGSSYLIHWFNNGALFATTTVPMVTYTKTHNTDSITARVVSTAVGCYDSTLSAFHFVYDSATVVINNIAATAAIMVYPNPAQKELTVTSVETMESVAIINLVGEAVIEQKKVGKKAIVNIGGLASGVYFVRVNGQYWRQFVKE